MKKLIYLTLISVHGIVFSSTENCDALYKQRENRIMCKIRNNVKTQESFFPRCYKDGFINGKQKYSIGYGSAEGFYNSNYCEELYSKLTTKKPRLRHLSKDYVMRNHVEITKLRANERLDRDYRGFYNKLSNNFYNKTKKKMENVFNDNQLISLTDKLYREGETRFNAGYIWTLLKKYPNYTLQDLIKAFKVSEKEACGVHARALHQMLSFNDKYFIDLNTINRHFNLSKCKKS
jgi:hypothetical protein